MNPATDVRHLPAGILRAIAMLTLVLAAAGAVKADAIADLDEWAARAAALPVAGGHTIAIDGGSKDVPVGGLVP